MPICRKCLTPFPNAVRVNGVRRSLQNRSFCLSCSPYDQHNTRDLTEYELTPTTRRCPRCEKTLPLRGFYRRRGKEGYSVYCVACANRQSVERQQALKRQAVAYKGGRCAHCGYDRYIGSLEFHHTDPDAKDFSLPAAQCTRFEKTQPELDKCILLCANCHREEHARIKGLL